MDFNEYFLRAKNFIKKYTDKLSVLDKYILKQVIEVFIMGVVIFTAIIFASDTFITLIKQISMYGIPFHIALMIIILNLPAVIVMTIPMGILFATVMTLNKLCLLSEITVMKACGIGLNRIAKPIFIFAILMAFLGFFVNETIVPITNSQSKTLAMWALGQKNIPSGKQNFSFKELKDGTTLKRLFFVENCIEDELKNVILLDLSNKDTIQVVHSKTGKTTVDGWYFNNGVVYTIQNDNKVLNTTWFENSVANFGLDLKKEMKKNEVKQYNTIALAKKIFKKDFEDNQIGIQYKIELFDKFAMPITTVIFVLLGVPLAITPPRVRYNRGFLFSILIIFLYYLVRALSLSLGGAEKIPTFFAAWMPNIILLTLGLWLYYKKVFKI